MPTLTGRYVGSGEMTERFLWDFRRTLCDLFAENYYDHFAELCHKHGLKFSVEPYDGPFECLQAGAKADIVMGEFWATTDLQRRHGPLGQAGGLGRQHARHSASSAPSRSPRSRANTATGWAIPAC